MRCAGCCGAAGGGDIHAVIDPKDGDYFRSSREQRFGMTLEAVQADGRANRLAAFRDSLTPARLVLRAQPWLGGTRRAMPITSCSARCNGRAASAGLRFWRRTIRWWRGRSGRWICMAGWGGRRCGCRARDVAVSCGCGGGLRRLEGCRSPHNTEAQRPQGSQGGKTRYCASRAAGCWSLSSLIPGCGED